MVAEGIPTADCRAQNGNRDRRTGKVFVSQQEAAQEKAIARQLRDDFLMCRQIC